MGKPHRLTHLGQEYSWYLFKYFKLTYMWFVDCNSSNTPTPQKNGNPTISMVGYICLLPSMIYEFSLNYVNAIKMINTLLHTLF